MIKFTAISDTIYILPQFRVTGSSSHWVEEEERNAFSLEMDDESNIAAIQGLVNGNMPRMTHLDIFVTTWEVAARIAAEIRPNSRLKARVFVSGLRGELHLH